MMKISDNSLSWLKKPWWVTVVTLTPFLTPMTIAQGGTRVVLSPYTYTAEQLNELQPVADLVARTVDALVPGIPSDYPPNGIRCAEAPPRWRTPEYRKQFSPPPVTLSAPLVRDEAPDAVGGSLRIYLDENPGPNKESLVFQLSHELAHAKMGHRTDNFLDETFAVAISLEVMRLLGYEDFKQRNEDMYLSGLPSAVHDLVTKQRWEDMRSAWLEMSKEENAKPGAEQEADTPFQFLGALLVIHDKDLSWSELLNVGDANTCAADGNKDFEVCPPDLSRMGMQRSLLRPLGLTTASRLNHR